MHRFALLVVLMMSAGLLHAEPLIRHDMAIRLQPTKHKIAVKDAITLPDSLASATTVHFVLHGGLQPVSSTAGVQIVREQAGPRPAHFGIDTGSFSSGEEVPLERYAVSLPAGTRGFVLEYEGEIYHPLAEQGEEYDRSFRETPGVISRQGVFLTGATYWYPWFSDDLVTFTLDVRLPQAWEAISQGKRTRHVQERRWTRVRWEAPEPQDEIYLTAGKFTQYNRTTGPVNAMIFLRTPNAKLAKDYLDATAKYIKMYGTLIGPYPYRKFALVENFWETGYGMPSFTLLGPKVIRFPFILHSSYPHEILHNWWGNGVFVDYQTGNWSEGLTAYLADHLVQEQRGAAVTYRRTALQKYADYVTAAKDFPLAEFHVRHSAVTQAIGYDKALMVFHMLRLQLGDDVFTHALQAFYRDNKFRRAAFADLRRAFEGIAGKDLQQEFVQWTARSGAPALRVSQAIARPDGKDYLLSATVEQVQPGPAYRLRVPVAVHLEGHEKAYQTTAVMDGKRLELALHTRDRPLRLDVDPEFDVFRRLHLSEIPPALSQAFGADKALILLPGTATLEVRRGYRQLAESWQRRQPGRIDIAVDNEIDELPVDAAVWLFGWENRFRARMASALADYDVSLGDTGIRIAGTDFIRANHSMVLNGRGPGGAALALSWLATDNVSAMPGLGRKLPHYGKYSYLVFEGDEPVSVAKGQWPVAHSPMSVAVTQADGIAPKQVQGKLAPRRALIYSPVDFSQERMLRDIRWLSRDALRGRGFGTPELDQVADFLATEFQQAGLQPGGDKAGSYFQVWTERGGEPARKVVMRNVVGVIPGSEPAWRGQSVVVGAHYDHLGLGWPDVHEGDQGKIHPGADDNASGVAVLLELARALGKESKRPRTVVFVAFAGEEAERRGSKHYVTHATRFPPAKIMGMLNIDTVGRLGQRKLMVLGAGSAREWNHIFRGVGYVTGTSLALVADDLGSSDQKSFLDAGVPAVQVFSGPHLDYHRPTDTADRIDPAGLAKAAAVIREAVEYLAARAEPLTSTLLAQQRTPSRPQARPASRRTVSLGTVPDFAYRGGGVRLGGLVPGSPAEKAGFRAGDIIIRLGNTPIDGLRTFSDVLKTLRPGDTVAVTFDRNGEERTLTVEAVSR